MFKKTWRYTIMALLTFSSAFTALPGRAADFDPQTTAAYLMEFFGNLQRLEGLNPENISADEFAQHLRVVAKDIRKIPVEGVERQARVLVWRWAALLEKWGNLLERFAAGQQRAIEYGLTGGALIGGGIGNEDPLLALLGGAILLFGGAQADQEYKVILDQANKLREETERLDQDMQKYLRWFKPYAEQLGLEW